ncbi:MAG: hypothetical protein U0271_27570 [Polyangiaceae bacterium]
MSSRFGLAIGLAFAVVALSASACEDVIVFGFESSSTGGGQDMPVRMAIADLRTGFALEGVRVFGTNADIDVTTGADGVAWAPSGTRGEVSVAWETPTASGVSRHIETRDLDADDFVFLIDATYLLPFLTHRSIEITPTGVPGVASFDYALSCGEFITPQHASPFLLEGYGGCPAAWDFQWAVVARDSSGAPLGFAVANDRLDEGDVVREAPLDTTTSVVNVSFTGTGGVDHALLSAGLRGWDDTEFVSSSSELVAPGNDGDATLPVFVTSLAGVSTCMRQVLALTGADCATATLSRCDSLEAPFEYDNVAHPYISGDLDALSVGLRSGGSAGLELRVRATWTAVDGTPVEWVQHFAPGEAAIALPELPSDLIGTYAPASSPTIVIEHAWSEPGEAVVSVPLTCP